MCMNESSSTLATWRIPEPEDPTSSAARRHQANILLMLIRHESGTSRTHRSLCAVTSALGGSSPLCVPTTKHARAVRPIDAQRNQVSWIAFRRIRARVPSVDCTPINNRKVPEERSASSESAQETNGSLCHGGSGDGGADWQRATSRYRFCARADGL